MRKGLFYMADENNQITTQRRARINNMKKVILLIALVLIIIPIILCIILSIKVCSLENQIDDLLDMKRDGRLTAYVDEEGNKKLIINNQPVQSQAKNQGIVSADKNEEDTKKESEDYSTDNTEENNSENKNIPNEETTTADTSKRGYGKTVCLTFDDGPSGNTEKIIEILDRYNVKATFFVIGKEDEESFERYRMIVESGNAIGLHSYTHDYAKVYNSIEDFVSEITRVHDVVYEATGVDTRLFRFPGGSSNSTVTKMDIHECIDYLNENGYTYYDWNVSSGDAATRLATVEQIMENIENDLFKMNTAIILMHDAEYKPTTVEALPQLIDMLLDEGFEIKVIDETIPTIQQIKSQ